LSGFFFMLTLLCYAKAVTSDKWRVTSKDTNSPLITHHSSLFRLALLFFVFGLLSKPMLVTVPVVLLLLDFWPLGRFTIHDLRFTIFPLIREKIPFFLLSIIVGVITLFAQRAGGSWVPVNTPIYSRIGNVVIGYWNYIEKLFWPQNLSFLYLRSDKISVSEFFLAAFVLAAISAVAALQFRRRPWFATGCLWFLVMLLPVSGLLQLGRLSIADRYTYLPAIGFYIVVVWGVADMLAVLFSRKICHWLAAAGATTVLLACAIMTRQQLAYWQNPQTLMEHALKVDPDNYVAQIDLRIYLFDKAHPGVREHHAGSSPEK